MIEKNFAANVINAILLTLVGLAIAFFSDLIGTNSRNFIDYITGMPNTNSYRINWWVIAFWFLQVLSVFYLIRLIYSQGKIEEKKVIDNQKFLKQLDKENKEFLGDINKDITGAIHNAPNPTVFSDYNFIYLTILETLRILHLSKVDKKESLKLYTTAFQDILSNLVLLTSSFSHKSGASYCANIMLYTHTDDNDHKIHNMINNNEIFPFQQSDKNHLFIRGVLEGKRELIYHTENRKNVPLLNLPLLANPDGGMVYIPGACKALDLGESVIDSTDLNGKTDYDHLPKQLWERLKGFFEQEDNEIRSVVSIAIPKPNQFDLFRRNSDKSKPQVLGVLNIDCSHKNIIGNASHYHQTFFSLIWPIIVEISSYLENYIYFSSVVADAHDK